MRLKLISCEVFYREMAAASARSPNHIEVDFFPPALHKDSPDEKRRRLQAVIDACDSSRFQAVLLGYALCGAELAGLKARSIPLVLPRSLDCVTYLLNQQCLEQIGSLRMQPAIHLHATASPQGRLGLSAPEAPTPVNGALECSLEHLAVRYGSEVARYIRDGLKEVRHIPLESGPPLRSVRPAPMPRNRLSLLPRQKAGVPCLHSESVLIQKMVDGYWSYDQFLVVPSHWEVRLTLDARITAVQNTHE